MAGSGRTPVATGEIAGSATALQLPNIAVPTSVIFKALRSNAGNVYLGLSSSVTAAAGTLDITSGLELDAGESVELTVGNLNELYIICDNAGDDLSYMVLS